MLYKAFVKDKETGKVNFMEYDYDSKSDFIRDLKLNGYTVIRVEPKELYDFVLDNTNADKYDWEAAKKLYKEHRPLTKEELDKMKHSVYNSKKTIKSANVEMKDFDEIIRVNISPESTKIPKLYRQAVINRDRNTWEQMKDMIYNEPYIDVETFNTWWVPRLNKMERKLFSSKQIKSSDLKVDPVSPVHPIPEKLPKKEEKLKTAKKKLTDKNGKTFEDYLNEEATKSGYDRNHEAIDKLFNVRRLLREDYFKKHFMDD